MNPGEIAAKLRTQATTADAVGVAVLQWRANAFCLPHRDKRAAEEASSDAAELAYTCRELATMLDLGVVYRVGT